MTLKLIRELGIKSRMQKRYRKPKTVVTVDQKLVSFRNWHCEGLFMVRYKL